MKKSLDDYKNFIGQTYNWLTITDIIRNPVDNRVWANCICRCGNITSKALRKILSGHVKSCGCYNRSKEKGALHAQWYKDNPERRDSMIQKIVQWRENNQDKCNVISDKISLWYKDNPDKVKEKAEQFSKWCKDNQELVEKYASQSKERRKQYRRTLFENISTDELSFIHPDDLEQLILGSITAHDFIRTKCPICCNYSYHVAHSVIHFNSNTYQNRSCSRCSYEYSQSKTENEVADYISSFYNGKCVRNSREIISPLELDLYYPEKKIAIEFNGDYWHSDEFKQPDYHYSKFIACKNIGILLVSIFETKWLTDTSKIKLYLHDLFSGIENELSFDLNGYINNNYPSPIRNSADNIITDFYTNKNNHKVYTCGYSNIELESDI